MHGARCFGCFQGQEWFQLAPLSHEARGRAVGRLRNRCNRRQLFENAQSGAGDASSELHAQSLCMAFVSALLLALLTGRRLQCLAVALCPSVRAPIIQRGLSVSTHRRPCGLPSFRRELSRATQGAGLLPPSSGPLCGTYGQHSGGSHAHGAHVSVRLLPWKRHGSVCRSCRAAFRTTAPCVLRFVVPVRRCFPARLAAG